MSLVVDFLALALEVELALCQLDMMASATVLLEINPVYHIPSSVSISGLNQLVRFWKRDLFLLVLKMKGLTWVLIQGCY